MAQEIITLQDLQEFRVQLLNDLRELLVINQKLTPVKNV
jgi:hypothetical protein